jgi:hypothetical protein
MLNLLIKSKLLDEKSVTTEDTIHIIEKYYSKGERLCDKLTDEEFQKYYKENPLLSSVNREIVEIN